MWIARHAADRTSGHITFQGRCSPSPSNHELHAEASPTYYVVEPKAQLKAMTEMDDLGLDLVGIFHSHVATGAYPSRTDVELAAYPDAAYLIMSLANQDAPVLRAFRIRDGRVDEVELERRTAGVAG